jgi:hypothetical protein
MAQNEQLDDADGFVLPANSPVRRRLGKADPQISQITQIDWGSRYHPGPEKLAVVGEQHALWSSEAPALDVSGEPPGPAEAGKR